MRIIRVLREAAEEVTEAAAHYEEEQNGLGVQFENVVHDALHLLSEDEMVPLSNVSESLTRAGVKCLIMRRFPYSISVRESRQTVDILAFAHHSRRPEYWRGRLST